MRRFGAVLLSVLLLAVYLAPGASGEPVETGEGRGAGWSVGVPGVGSVTLTPEAVATVPVPCPPSPELCEDHETKELLAQSVGDTVATASLLRSHADAYKDGGATASLQTVMEGASGIALPSTWNTRGYARAEGVSLLNGSILVDSVEAETVTGLRTTNGTVKEVSASGARVVNLRLAGALALESLAPIIPDQPNQVLFNSGGIRIVYWETNWDPATGTTTDGQPIWVTSLRGTAALSGIDIKLAQAQSTAKPPPPPAGPPVAGDDSATTAQDSAVTIDVAANDSDPDGDLDPATVSVTGQPASGTVTCTNGSCVYTPNPSFTGTDSFTYQICDAGGRCDAATVTITVSATSGGGGGGGGGGTAPANNPPVAEDDTASTTEGSAVKINPVANDGDPDGDLDPSSVTVTRSPASGEVVCDGGTCTYSPRPGFVGTDSFEYRVCDTNNACDTAIVTVTVGSGTQGDTGTGGGNNPPVAVDDNRATTAGSSVTVTVVSNDSDPDGNLDPATLAITRQPQNGSVICKDGSCTYTPNPGFAGTDSFEYRVCDTNNACDTATVTVIVGDAGTGSGPGNNPPAAANDSVSTGPGAPVTIVVTDNDADPDGDLDPSSVTVTVPPEHGAVICDAGSCTYTPDPGFSGTDSFTYRVCDALGACTTAVVSIMVPGAPNTDTDSGDGGGSGPQDEEPRSDDQTQDRPYRDGTDAEPGPDGSGPGGHGGPTADPSSPAPGAPTGLDRPVLGAPNAPLPFTGGDPGFYVAGALNLLLIGMLLLLIDRFTRSAHAAKPCPAWHNHEEAHDSKLCAYGEWS